MLTYRFMGENHKIRRERKNEPQHSSDVLFSLLKKANTPLGEQFIRWRLWNQWQEVVGAEIAAHTRPVQFIRGQLYVWVKSAARMQDLTFLAKPIIEKINQFGGKKWVKSIRFTLDRKSVPSPEESEERLLKFLSKTTPNEDSDPSRGR